MTGQQDIEVDRKQRLIVSRARGRVGLTKYVFYTERVDLPMTANCHTFVWWVMNSCKVAFPWFLPDQVRTGCRVEDRNQWLPADVIFTRGLNDQTYGCEAGHVGIFTGRTVVHACSKRRVVVEEPIDIFLLAHRLVVVRRVLALV